MIELPYSGKGQNRGKKRTHDACRIIGCDDDILQSELVQIERVPSQLRICAVKAFTASYELDKQRDGTLDNILRLCKQGLVLSSRWSSLGEKRAGRSTLTLGASEEVCTRCWERAAVDRERGAAFDIEARVHEWAERRRSRRGGYWQRSGWRVAGLRENNG